MLCHKCPHLDSIQSGDYASSPWKDTPCAKCSFGASPCFIEPFDEENPPEYPASGFPAYSNLSGGSPSSLESTLLPQEEDPDNKFFPGSMFHEFFQAMLSLEPCLRDIVGWRYQGLTYREIAERQGTSSQLAEMRHKRALREWPVLKALFPAKMARQARRNMSE